MEVTGMNKQPAGDLVKFIDRNQEWLKQVIDLRDRMNHYKSGGIGLDNFTVFVRKMGGKDVLVLTEAAQFRTFDPLI